MKRRILALAAAAVMTLTAVAPVYAFPKGDELEGAYTTTQAQAVAYSLIEEKGVTLVLGDIETDLDDIVVDNIRALTSGEQTDMVKALAHFIQFNKVNFGKGLEIDYAYDYEVNWESPRESDAKKVLAAAGYEEYEMTPDMIDTTLTALKQRYKDAGTTFPHTTTDVDESSIELVFDAGYFVGMDVGDVQATGKGDITYDASEYGVGAGKAVYLIHLHDGRAYYDVDYTNNDGKVTYTVDGFSPIAFIVTDYNKKDAPENITGTNWTIPNPSAEVAGASTKPDAAGAAGANTAAAGTAAAGTAAAGTAAGSGAAGANAGASPKTSDSNTLYVLFAMAAVAGTAVVATKKSR